MNMQICKECGASWDVKRIIDVCPFCGADLREKATADSIEDAFTMILERHGQGAFQSEVLLGLLSDYAPTLTRERKLVKIAVESGAYRAICEAPNSEKEHILNKYVSILSDSYFINETWAKKVLLWCMQTIMPDSSICSVNVNNACISTDTTVLLSGDHVDSLSKSMLGHSTGIKRTDSTANTSRDEVERNTNTENYLSGVQKTSFHGMYLYTILKGIEGEGKYKKNDLPYGEYGVVRIQFEPREVGGGFHFENAISDGSVPQNYIPAIERRLYECAQEGIITGIPVVGVTAILCGGSYHPVASTKNAFQEAAHMAFADAMTKAYSVILEAIGTLTVYIPDEKIRDVFADISARRGLIMGMNPSDVPFMQIVVAEVPMPEMSDYSLALDSITNGKGYFTFDFCKYKQAPMNIVEKIRN